MQKVLFEVIPDHRAYTAFLIYDKPKTFFCFFLYHKYDGVLYSPNIYGIPPSILNGKHFDPDILLFPVCYKTYTALPHPLPLKVVFKLCYDLTSALYLEPKYP